MSQPTNTKNFDTLEVGAWYKDGRGRIEQVIAHHPEQEIAWQYETNIDFYYPNGQLYEYKKTLTDLIERVNEDGTRWEPK
jgi:hypothetical protein